MSVEFDDRKFESQNLEYKLFEGVKIQWEKGEWEFQHPTLGRITKPTYSLLNPLHWSEIVDLFNDGKVAAGMMMGNFGVIKKLDTLESADTLFNIKEGRPRDQNFVALVHPKDLINIIDISRLQEPHKTKLLQVEERERLYAGPQHVILPVKNEGINKALIRQADQTIACFWVPDHFGFEGLVSEARNKIKNGLLGGGSLNIHGKEPYYSKDSLRDAIAKQKEWLEEIDFIIFDDITEARGIGRSHTMIRYSGEKPEIIRVGSLSIDTIREKTGHDVRLSKEVKYASSKTPYSEQNDKIVDEKVRDVLQRIKRFNLFIQGQVVRK
ncbi:MAG: Sua5/YciO/YrdC/YwlC family protein [Candidatus Levybacteria bacterium]|nr:Sua5/YciO/YrdC/YwlC family protein [Candidatus Levybacteria bacterium]